MTEVLDVAAVQRLIAGARQEAPLSPVMTQCLDQLDAHATALATARAEIARLSAPPPSAHGPGWDERREAKPPRRLDLAAALVDQEAARAAKKAAIAPSPVAAAPDTNIDDADLQARRARESRPAFRNAQRNDEHPHWRRLVRGAARPATGAFAHPGSR
jgi:hypothetical protein